MTPGFLRTALSFVLLPFLLTACLHRPPTITGTLRGDIRWEGVVGLSGDVLLPEDSRLTIAPGTTVLFFPPGPGQDLLVEHPHFPGSELIVRGTLSAAGTPEAPITFRYADPGAPPGSWGGVNIQQSPGADFRFCRFTQADSALHSQESRVTVAESLFEENLVAIRFHTSEMLIEHNRIHRNGTGIRFHFGAPVIRGNDIRENGKGIFFTSHPSDFRIEGNNIAGNLEFSVVLGEEVPETVPMPGNWWGSDEPERIVASLFDGRREKHLGRVDFSPPAGSPVPGAGISWKP